MPLTELRRAFTPFSVLLSLFVCVNPCVASAANTAPTISGSPPTSVAAGNAYYFKPTTKDSDGDTLKFSIVNKPGWLSFSSSTGALSGTPTSYHVGNVYAGIKIWVTDGIADRSLDGFSITVTASGSSSSGNTAPKISGTPSKSAVVGKAYAFQPTASDANGDKLTFTIKNKPGWAAFSTSTGRLSGTPSSSSVGSFSSIVISASDGKVWSSLPAFTINVSMTAPDGEVTLSWSAPTRNTDGTQLTNLSGYRVYYGQNSGSYSRTLSLPSPSLTSVGIEGLATGTWYFAVKALASDGQESALSSRVSKYVQ
jgi:hypothetical protein